MEEDEDEFGDLYTDVLRPSQNAPVFPQNSASSIPKSALQSSPTSDDDEDILFAPSSNISNLPLPSSDSTPRTHAESNTSGAPQHHPTQRSPLPQEKEPPEASNSPIPGSPRDAVAQLHLNQSSPLPEVRVSAQDAGTRVLEMDDGIADLDSDPVIPGLSTGPSIPGIFHGGTENGDAKGSSSRKDDSGGGGDDWDSDDSEDDIQIVLNDNTGPIGMEQNDDEDEDGEDLVIVADGDQHHQEIEDQEWGDEAGQAVADGERKEMGEAVKGNGGAVVGVGVGVGVGARIGYSGHGYHPHHSQFKYVRPGAASAAVSTGAPGLVRPPVNVGLLAGRGRGDWRPIGLNKSVPTMQKSFHSGFGVPGWANNSSIRPFGSGLEFTLPSHKSVFDVDIDSFEEKPWKYPGVDMSDYFNFGLDEDIWKDYCKQLDQLRLEATMQSKIRVYESGRSEQDYDPDLPPELAAAAGLQDISNENANLRKTDTGQADLVGQGRGASRIRPPLPTGRAIQVEAGFGGERLPSIDTRPPRQRDSDAIIEIVLQDSVDDDSISNITLDRPENGLQLDDPRGGPDVEEDDKRPNTEYFDRFPPTYNGRKREMMSGRVPFMGSVHNNIQEGDGILPFPSEAPLQYPLGSKAQAPIYPGGPFGAPQGGRWPQGIARERYLHKGSEHPSDASPSQSVQNRFEGHQREKSVDNIEGKGTPEASSAAGIETRRDQSLEQKDDTHDDEQLALADSLEVEGEEMGSDLGIPSETLEDDSTLHTVKKQKLSSRVEQPEVLDNGSGDNLMATHSDSSKAKSGNSRDYQKRHDGGDEEVVQDGRSRRIGESKRHHDEDESGYRRRDDYSRASRHEIDRRLIAKGREDLHHSYPHRDWDSSSAHYARARTDGFDRTKERDNSAGSWQRRDEDAHGRRAKDEDMRRRERVEETGSRHKKLNENERIDKDEFPYSRKRVDDGDWRGRHEKDGGTRQRERDDVSMGRHESLNELHKRRKEEEQRREYVDKEDVLHGYKTREDSSRRKRERDDSLDQRRKEDLTRARDKLDEHHSVKLRDESWRQRDRDDRHRLKQPHEDTQGNREREEVRGSVRSGRADDKQWAGNTRAKDESRSLGSEKDYQLKEKRRQSEQPKRRDRVEEETSSQHRGRDAYSRENRFGSEERNPRHERSSSQNNHPLSAENQRLYKGREKDSIRKSKESEGPDQSTLLPSKRKHDEHNTHHSEKVSNKGMGDQESGSVPLMGHTDSRDRDRSQSRSSSAAISKSQHHHHHEQQEAEHHSSRKHGEDATSDDDQQSNSRRGRSKLERWTSQKDRDISTNALSSSSKGKETGGRNSRSLASEHMDGSLKTGGVVDSQHPSGGDENVGDLEHRDNNIPVEADSQHVDTEKIRDDRHLDTVEKLKKRSERFKLPMPSEKETATSRKAVENEPGLAQGEAAADAEIKQERPARKRRWSVTESKS